MAWQCLSSAALGRSDFSSLFLDIGACAHRSWKCVYSSFIFITSLLGQNLLASVFCSCCFLCAVTLSTHQNVTCILCWKKVAWCLQPRHSRFCVTVIKFLVIAFCLSRTDQLASVSVMLRGWLLYACVCCHPIHERTVPFRTSGQAQWHDFRLLPLKISIVEIVARYPFCSEL